uniref:Complex 1 LYR protein domain-containing protein n=1 Tax=Aplanochytrium stocchinoi TaxID=215587 RepID=A0A7S3PD97_9STRA|mmetsp:Transcript_11130/g.13906  ORF Transcript_11130/g.13906 Transcript_11130/m.13906 type:complete len:102 (-) Transcript_11130:586-891(-)|eukprot:CAMPEP_0204828076 /NCGR_PEP_ID=MMETSP1346-20131115/5677_1 /ASSEMBLY_ACC=CAM_ASM_000771 /TAXON_ID=215587 /ORGANISM="Aplanochytrium stocchinoi, Strain GSBS06" /LENGTH=101 /DNA_ID=CAMNT_0051956863 /DNA_START=330 /DNA_END=635 /DNA_ORIENTATION=-
MSVPSSGGFKTTVQIYRDSLRLIKHIAGESPKAHNIRNVVRQEFRRNSNVTDPQKIEDLKFNAVRGLSNYLVYQAAMKDEQIQRKIKEWENENSSMTTPPQ